MKKLTLILFILVLSCSTDDIIVNENETNEAVVEVLTTNTEEETEETTEEEITIVGTWQRIVSDDQGTLDTRTITISEDGTGNQVEIIPKWYDPCVYTSCPYYIPETTWHISFTYSVNEDNSKISIDYLHYYDYINFNGQECNYCLSTFPVHEDLVDIDLNLVEGFFMYTDNNGTEFKYNKVN